MTDKNNSQPVAFVTGAARGIGLAIANWFLAHDYRVALIDIDSATLAKTAGAASGRSSGNQIRAN